jgi:hypothetical protein
MPDGSQFEGFKKQESEGRRSMREVGEREFTKDAQLETLGEQYQGVQKRIADLEQDLEKGNQKALELGESPMRDISIRIGRELTRELGELADKKLELEGKIQSVGGNPSDYTLQ